MPYRLYRNTPQWCPPFRFDIENIFSKKKNKFFQDGECERFLIYHENKAVGRFALMNHRINDAVFEPKLAGIGFIEMENNQGIANTMIDYAKQWHLKRGYNAMRGPINFGPDFCHWGCLTNKYDQAPIYGMPYNPAFHVDLLENSGALKLQDHIRYSLTLAEQNTNERILRITQRIEKRPNITWRSINKKDLEPDIVIIHNILNDTLKSHSDEDKTVVFQEFSLNEIRTQVNELKLIIQPEYNLIGFVDDKPAALALSVPDLNQLSQTTNGKLHWWHLPRILNFKNKVDRLRIIVIACKAEYRKTGIELLLWHKGRGLTTTAFPQIKNVIGGWIAEDNRLARSMSTQVGFKSDTIHRTYKWDF